jgi:hypothetical protein
MTSGLATALAALVPDPLLLLCRAAALLQELLDRIRLPYSLLDGLLEGAEGRLVAREPHLVRTDIEHHFVTGLDPQPTADFRRDDDAAVPVYPRLVN